jgi:hypothetical protein
VEEHPVFPKNVLEKLEKRRQSNEELDKVCNFRKKTMETKEQEKGKGHYDEFNNTSHKEI